MTEDEKQHLWTLHTTYENAVKKYDSIPMVEGNPRPKIEAQYQRKAAIDKLTGYVKWLKGKYEEDPWG
jgi:hypothetical protein